MAAGSGDFDGTLGGGLPVDVAESTGLSLVRGFS